MGSFLGKLLSKRCKRDVKTKLCLLPSGVKISPLSPCLAPKISASNHPNLSVKKTVTKTPYNLYLIEIRLN